MICILFNSFVFKIANTYVVAGILLPFLIAMIIMTGFKKDNFRYKKDVLLNILISLLIYYFITYLLGLFTGFIMNSYSLSIVNIIKNTFPVILLIVISELLRYEIFTKINGNITCLILGCIIFVMIDVNQMVHLYDVMTLEGLMKMICLVMFPSITKTIFLAYVTNKVGYTNALFYAGITGLSTYIFPIFPDFGEYLNVLLETILPIIIMARLNGMFNYYETRKIKSSRYNNSKMIFYSVITFILLVIVILTSGLFKYQALTIGSASMSKKIEKGDVIILKRIKQTELSEIKKGDILVYNHDNIIIVHRVVKILNVNGKKDFITKGDNNDTKDAWVVKGSDVIGVVKTRVRWIGMPTVALNELLNK